MQKLVLVEDNYTGALDQYLSKGWYIKDFKPVSEHVSVSCGGENGFSDRITGKVYAYVLLEKIEMESRERIPLNEKSIRHVKPVKGEMILGDDYN